LGDPCSICEAARSIDHTEGVEPSATVRLRVVRLLPYAIGHLPFNGWQVKGVIREDFDAFMLKLAKCNV
jgi:hypothetical protein